MTSTQEAAVRKLQRNPNLMRVIHGYMRYITDRQLTLLRRLDIDEWRNIDRVVLAGEKRGVILRSLEPLIERGFVEQDSNDVTQLYTLTERGVFAEYVAKEKGR